MQHKKVSWFEKIILTVIIIYLTIPLLASLLYALTTSWGATLLPENYTFALFKKLWHDPRFLTALQHTLTLIAGTLVISTIILIPVVFLIYYKLIKLKGFFEIIVLLPFMVPAIVTSVGLLNLYADEPLTLTGTPWILYGTYFTIATPFIYRSLANAFEGIDLKNIIEAAHILGATTEQAFISIILPCLRKGILIGFCLTFSILLGEFVYSKLLVGAHYETLQLYLNEMRSQDAHLSSAVVMSYFGITLIVTLIASKLRKRKSL